MWECSQAQRRTFQKQRISTCLTEDLSNNDCDCPTVLERIAIHMSEEMYQNGPHAWTTVTATSAFGMYIYRIETEDLRHRMKALFPESSSLHGGFVGQHIKARQLASSNHKIVAEAVQLWHAKTLP